MKTVSIPRAATIVVTAGLFLFSFGIPTPAASQRANSTEQPTEEKKAEGARLPSSQEEAKARAVLLHEAFRGVLQVMHRDFFDPGDRNRIPSASLEDVFDEMAKTHGVQIRWIGVNAKTMNIDHEARDDFEKKAVEAIAGGKKMFESVEGDRYRRAGAIILHNACLKCHVPDRKSLEDRAAGLVISMPFKRKKSAEPNNAGK